MDSSTALPPAAAACGVSFDGRAYHYQQYSYDRLADALAYARLDRNRHGWHDGPAARHWKQWAEPTVDERLQMAAHGIVYERGQYCYGPYRYDALDAALAYAARAPGLATAAPPAAKAAGR